MSHAQVCPLGLATLEGDCPNAPCLDCMRRLGVHLIAELDVMRRQSMIAKTKGNMPAFTSLVVMLNDLKHLITERENAHEHHQL